MFKAAILATAALSGLVSAAPAPVARSYTLPDNGFPNPNAAQLRAIEEQADGTLSNAPPPPKLAPASLTTFQAIAFNENFEIGFFESLFKNVTEGYDGYGAYEGYGVEELAQILKTVIAQEQLHSINAVNVLNRFGVLAPAPCEYVFPTENIRDAIALATTHTSLVLGTLQDASQTFAIGGDNGAVRAVTSVLGQEGEQNGFYRALLARQPSQKPFLTTNVGPFLFSYIQQFVKACPFNVKDIPIPIFPLLAVEGSTVAADVESRDQNLRYSVDLSNIAAAEHYHGGRGEGLFITYFSGQLLPISVPIENVHWEGGKISFTAFFPYEENVMDGLSVAALTTRKDFASASELPAATLAGPGLVQVNDLIQ